MTFHHTRGHVFADICSMQSGSATFLDRSERKRVHADATFGAKTHGKS